MLRCRRCRRVVIDSAGLETVEETIESSAAVCNVWHINVDMLPEWMLTSVNQAQWTVGKLNCQNCTARVGGFNFINSCACPCGRYARVHLNKSRVDRDQTTQVLIVQPKRMRLERGGHARVISDPPQTSEAGLTPNSLQLNCAAVMSRVFPAEADSENTFPFSPLYCISHRRRRSMEDDAAFRASCFCRAGPTDESAFNLSKAGAGEATLSPVSFPACQQFDTGAEASSSAGARLPCFSGARHTDHAVLRTVGGVESCGETAAVHKDVLDSGLFLRGRTVPNSATEQENQVVPPASNRLRKREKNRLKSVKRKQKRRERWLQSQLDQDQCGRVSGLLLDSEEEDREGLTCAVCLDIYFSPHSCQPCGHVFCEPCLRTLARNRPANTPCPLCRTLISRTSFHRDLNQTAKTVFPKVYCARKEHFQNALCAKWPLPSIQKGFRTFWAYQRQTAMSRRRWHFAHAGFTMHTLDFTDMRGWLFDIGLVIVYIHSVNWILVILLLCFLTYYFFF